MPHSIAFELTEGSARRFYRLHVQPSRQLTLFGGEPQELELVIVYGRIDSWAHRRAERFASGAALGKRWRTLVQRRRAHGYIEIASH